MKKKLVTLIVSILLALSTQAGAFPPGVSIPGNGSGDIVQSGSTSNHQWAYFTDDKTLAGKSVTASKPVCTDANGDPAVCAGTEGVWLAADGKAADADKLDNHDTSYFQVAGWIVQAGTNNVLTYTGNYSLGLTLSGNTALTLPTSGTLATTGIIASSISDSDTTHCPDGNSIYDALALKQGLNASLTALSGLSSPITVDGNNITVPGSLITTAANGSRKMAILANTVAVSPTATSFELYPDSDNTWKFNQNGTEYTPVLSPTAGQVILTGTDAARTKTVSNSNTTLADVDGALGTPSFTALNMPSSNADPGTTAGQIRHDSTDTGSSSGGTAKWYDGAQVRQLIDTGTNYSLITKYEYMPIRYAEDDDSVTAPAAAAEIGTTSMIARSFAEDADNAVVFFWQIPGDYVSGIKFRVFFATDTNASANETAVFNLKGCAFGSSAAIACTEGTGQESILELTTDEDTGELLVSGWSAAITIDGTPATGKIAKLLLTRDVAGGSAEDDMAGHALVTGIEIKYVGKVNAFGNY